MNIYISTGGFNDMTADKVIKNFEKYGILDIELSGGIYKEKLIKKLIYKKNKFNLKAHNYFPPPKKPFVINLASLDEKIFKKSQNLILNALKFSKKIDSKYYSFHAGFLCDIQIKDLGNKVKKKKLNSRKECTELFIKRVNKIAKVAKKLGIKLMIENNVITKRNLKEFGDNPFLMADPNECKKILNSLSDNVGLLVDVAHLKVSSNTLNFDPKKMFILCKNRILGYHISDNNGDRDSNSSFDDSSWFWKYIDYKKEYLSIEVYDRDPKNLKKLLELAKKKITKKKINHVKKNYS